jgi:hypothetical protein
MTYHSTTVLHVLDVNDDFYLGFENIFCHSLVILLTVNINSVTDTVMHQLATTQRHIQIDKSRTPLRVDKYI